MNIELIEYITKKMVRTKMWKGNVRNADIYRLENALALAVSYIQVYHPNYYFSLLIFN